MQFLNKLKFLPRPRFTVLSYCGIRPAAVIGKCGYSDSTGDTNQPPAPVILRERPKKPSSSFMLFLQSIRSNILSKQPDAKVQDVAKIAADMWKNSSDDVKAPFVEAYGKALQCYDEAIREYQESLTVEHVQLIQSENAAAAKRKMSRRMMQLGRPKKPSSKYALFVKSRKYELKNYPSLPEFLRAVATQYRKLPQEELQKYDAKAAEDRDTYKAELAAWEDRILESTDKSLRTVQIAILKARKNIESKKQTVAATKSVKKQTVAAEKPVKKQTVAAEKPVKKQTDAGKKQVKSVTKPKGTDKTSK